jgi:hypothetical protein
MSKISFFIAIMLAALAGSAQAATYYVDCESSAASDSHSDEQATSEATPWKTLWHAGWQAKPGDTVLVKGGECPDPEDISPIWDHNQAAFLLQNGEEAGRKWTYFKAYPGHHPHIRFKPTKTGIHIWGSYIWIEGFEISPNNYNPGEISCCDGNGHSGFGIWITGGKNGDGKTIDAHHVVIRNCNIHNCAAAGIGGNWADYMTIENNTIWNNSWWSNCGTSGIHIYQPLASNINSGTTTVNGTDYRIVIANNRIYGNDNKVNTCGVSWPSDGNGIALDDFSWAQPNSMLPEQLNKMYPHRTLVMNNLLYGNGGRGILVGGGHVDILQNTAYGNMQNAELRNTCGDQQEWCNMFGEIAVDGPDMRIFNNIAVAQHTRTLSVKLLTDWSKIIGADMTKKVAYGNNLTYGGWGIEDNGTSGLNAGGNFIQDPLLTAPSLDGSADFHLKNGSPAINKGSAANSVPLDFEAYRRPAGHRSL